MSTVSYSGDPSKSPLDEVRFLVGDTDCTAGVALLTNEEINFRITGEETTARAAWRSVQDIIAKLSSEAHDWSAGTTSQSKSQVIANYRQLEKELGTGRSAVALTAGGLSKSEKQANEEDDDLVQGQIRSNQFRNTRIGDSNSPTSIREGFN